MTNRKAVFVVDDDPTLLRGLQRLLRKRGFDAVLFESAAALRNHKDFDEACCLVLDINLGDGSGIALRQELREAGILLPVVYITGNDSQQTRRAAIESGCLAYLVKPFAASALIQSIEQI